MLRQLKLYSLRCAALSDHGSVVYNDDSCRRAVCNPTQHRHCHLLRTLEAVDGGQDVFEVGVAQVSHNLHIDGLPQQVFDVLPKLSSSAYKTLTAAADQIHYMLTTKASSSGSLRCIWDAAETRKVEVHGGVIIN